MYTHCPHCDTCFRVTSEQLKAARGSVRCGRCFGTFNALENLVDQPPQSEVETLPPLTEKAEPRPAPAKRVPTPVRASAPRPAPIEAEPKATAPEPKAAPTPAPAAKPAPSPTRRAAKVAATPKPATPPPPKKPPVRAEPPAAAPRKAAPEPVVPPPKPTVPPAPDISEPAAEPQPQMDSFTVDTAAVEEVTAAPPKQAPVSEAPQPTPREAQFERSQQLLEEIQSGPIKPARSLFWLWSLLSVALLLVFIVQYAWFNLASLAQQPQLRPALEAMCAIAKCEVPLIRAPYMITLVERDIRNDPAKPGVLEVKARIINKAPHTQAYPLMELSLHDITGHVIAARRFTPDEYLSRNMDQKQGMAPQQAVDINLELADPGKEAVGFEFAFF